MTKAWERHYNVGVEPHAEAMAVDLNGNTFVVGKVGTGGNPDLLTVRYDADGVFQWANTYDSGFGEYELGEALAVDHQGNVYVSGHSVGFDWSDDMVVIKYNEGGGQLWAERYTPTHWSYSILGMTVSEGGDLYLTGQHFTTMRYSPTGTRQWMQFDPDSWGTAASIATDSSGHVVVTGIGYAEHPDREIYTIKYTPAGAVMWTRGYAASRWYSTKGGGVAIHDDGYVVVTGGGTQDVITILYNASGDELWVRTLQGVDPSHIDRSYGVNVAFDSKGDILVSGRLTTAEWNSCDTAILKYDLAGNLLWTQTLAGVCSDGLHMALDDQDNIYTASGLSAEAMLVAKVTANGQIGWSQTVTVPGSWDWTDALGIGLDQDRNVYAGARRSEMGFIIVKFSQEASSEPPRIVERSPDDGDTNVDRFSTIQVLLEADNDIDPDSISLHLSTHGAFTLADPRLTFDGSVLLLDLGEETPLGDYAEYIVVNLEVADELGNGTTFQWKFQLPLRVEILAIEVMQSVQNWSNEVPLIQGKRTTVRVHVQSPDAASNTVGAIGVLHGRTLADQALPGSPLAMLPNWAGAVAVSTNSLMARGSSDATMNFSLPEAWTLHEHIQLEVELEGVAQINKEPAHPPDDPAGDGIVRLQLHPMPALPVRFVPVTIEMPGSVLSPPDPIQLGQDAWMMQLAFPTSHVQWDVTPGFRFDGTLLTNVFDLGLILDKISVLWMLEDRAAEDLFYGTFKYNGGLGGLAESTDNTASVAAGQFAFHDASTLLHEIGHLLGRPHPVSSNLFGVAPCSVDTNWISIQGACGECASTSETEVFPWFVTNINGHVVAGMGPLDSSNPYSGIFSILAHGHEPMIVAPDFATDLMSYCDMKYNLVAWPSQYTYELLKSAIATRFGTPDPPAAMGSFGRMQPHGTEQDYLIVRGVIYLAEESTEITSILRVSRTHAPPLPAPGDYLLELRGDLNELIDSYPFAPMETSAGPGPRQPFALIVPDHPDIRRIVITKGGEEVADLLASLNPPFVTLLSPNGGEYFAGATVPVEWAGMDADGDDLVYALFYRTDDAGPWIPVALDVTEETYEIPRDYLPGSTNARIRVVASDGFWTVSDESDDPFATAFHAPHVAFVTGTNRQTFYKGSAYNLEVMAYSIEHGLLTGSNIVWISSIDGEFASGNMIDDELSALSLGDHEIQVVVTDYDGNTGVSSIPIDVRAHRAPAIWYFDPLAGAGGFSVRGFADAPMQLIVETSTNFHDWFPAFTTSHRGVLFDLPVVPDTNATMQIFRVISNPED